MWVFHKNINIYELPGVMTMHFHCNPGVRIKCFQMTTFYQGIDRVRKTPVIYGYTFTVLNFGETPCTFGENNS